jgi:hypothetical protein
MIINSQIPTKIELNGPILSFDTGVAYHPISVVQCSGTTATFTGLATATFPVQSPPNPAENSGYISYKWYEVGIGPLSNGGRISGSDTNTLTIIGLQTPSDHSRQFYLKVDYINSAYSLPQGSVVTVGSAKSTGNALNDGLNSNIVTLEVYPNLQVVTNPTVQSVIQTRVATFTAEGSLTDSRQGDLSYNWQLNGQDIDDGTISNTIITGSKTKNLSIQSNNLGEYFVRAKLTHPTACNSPIYTESARYSVLSARQIVNIELLPSGGGSATLYSWNLFDQGEFSVGPPQIPTGNSMCFYAPEKDINVYIDLYANSGANNGGYSGGEGGVSTIQLTLNRNEEYQIMSLSQVNSGSSIFVYRKSRLIAAVGGGGNAGSGGNGGNGGGANVAGGDGSGRGGGTGGQLYLPGTLPSTGIFGSAVNSTLILKGGDGHASAPNGGRVLPCPRGDYWYDRGYSACQEMGNVQFYTATAGVISNSTSSITRGFKTGYGIRNTAGAGVSGGGQGGNGATGGNGGNGGGGGGGGSGYSDGSITIVSTRQGGNTGTGRVVLRLGDLL